VSVTYRNQTEAPTERGWYYARLPGARWQPKPTLVYPSRFGDLKAVDGVGLRDIDTLEWFGPVTECREG
jgi:hypothetical protein